MNAPLSRYLTRFGSDGTSVPPALAFEPEPQDAAFIVSDGETEAVFGVAKAETEAPEAEEARAVDIAHEQAIEALKAAHDIALRDAVAAARIEWAKAEAAAIAPLLDAAIVKLRDLFANRIAIVLKPLVAEATVARTVKLLGQAIDRILKDPKHPALTIRGPADLLDAIRAQRPQDDGMTFEESESVEVSVSATGMHIQTRLARALDKLAVKEH